MSTNTVTITDSSGTLQNVVAGAVTITSGESFEPPTVEFEDGTYTITLEAGREGSTEVAEKFVSRSGGTAEHVFAPFRGGGTPDELNFFIEVQLVFASTTVTVFVGQGNSVLRNNWWIGGGSVFSDDTPRFELTSGNQIITFPITGGVSSFEFGQITDVRPLSPIEHVFVLMLENHSFDNLLALSGIPGIIAATRDDHNSYQDKSFFFGPDAPDSMPTDPGHEFPDVLEQLAGPGASYPSGGPYPSISNSGFAANYATTTTEGPKPAAADIGEIMLGFAAESLPVLAGLAKEFVVCDQWFSSLPGPTWPNRFFLHGATSVGLDSSPSTAELAEWETVDGFRYPNGSIFDAMTAATITWRLYQDRSGRIDGDIPQVAALHNIDIFDVHSLADFASDLQNDYPYQYTFIEPNYGDLISGTYVGGSSQHPKDSVIGGEQLITAIYEAIRDSPVWASSMLIITYDEHGGFYDHFAPGSAPSTGDYNTKYNQHGFDFTQYGVRVPAVIISPWIAKGQVDHTIRDHTSVLATLEWLFGLRPLTPRDAAANNLMNLVADTLRTDCPTKLPRHPGAEQRRMLTDEAIAAHDQEPLPERSNELAFLGVALKLHSQLAATPEERAAGREEFLRMKTRGDARAFMRKVKAKIEAARASRE